MELGCVVCGVDASEASLDAARQAARLAPPDARLLVVAVAEVDVAVHAGFLAVRAADDLEREAEAVLARVRRELLEIRPLETRFLRARDPAGTLLSVARDGATLLCVGTHGWGRARGKALGRVSTRLLHEAPCSVLVARPARSAAVFPSGIAVGLDGSQEAEAAAEVAESLRERFDVQLRWIAAGASKGIDLDAIAAGRPELETPAEKAVDALVAASADVDLLVVGSRGLHGMRALGSVSERVAHHARCSVLVVRPEDPGSTSR